MRLLLVFTIALAASVALPSCMRGYDTERADRLVSLALSDSTLTQAQYANMISVLDEGFDYMRSRLAKAAFETNPSAAVNDIINLMDDSTLRAVNANSHVLILTLQQARLSSANARRFDRTLRKYNELQNSLRSDSAAFIRTAPR